jgi:hypothetical protein
MIHFGITFNKKSRSNKGKQLLPYKSRAVLLNEVLNGYVQ